MSPTLTPSAKLKLNHQLTPTGAMGNNRAKEKMKTTKEMEAYFLRIGHPQSDMKQLKAAIRECRLTLRDNTLKTERKIKAEEAIDLIGLETFLSGISRAAFHATCGRDSKDGRFSVDFNLLHWWK